MDESDQRVMRELIRERDEARERQRTRLGYSMTMMFGAIIGALFILATTGYELPNEAGMATAAQHQTLPANDAGIYYLPLGEGVVKVQLTYTDRPRIGGVMLAEKSVKQ